MTDEWHRCTGAVDGQRCTWEGTGTPARCLWHTIDVNALGPLGSDDPRARWAVVLLMGHVPEDARWSISSRAVAYWATEAEAEAYAASERVRGASRGLAAVAIHLEWGRGFDHLVELALYALERGHTRVV